MRHLYCPSTTLRNRDSCRACPESVLRASCREVRATPTHLLFRRRHLLLQRTHLLFRRTHLLLQRTHLLFRRTHLLFRRTHLLFRRVHNAAYETTKRVETCAAHTCVYTVAFTRGGLGWGNSITCVYTVAKTSGGLDYVHLHRELV